MSDTARLYDEDFVRWTETQAKALREAASAGANLPLDWENLAEEVEDLGKSLRRELSSRIATIMEHLMKLDFSSATDPRRGWARMVLRERDEISRLLEDAQSLRREIGQMILDEAPRLAKRVAFDLSSYGETDPALLAKLTGACYTEDQILSDWLPGERDATAT
jgi:epoxyqueuosine reductase QueG